MLASTAVWFPKEVLETSGKIMNADEPYLLVPTEEGNRNNWAPDNDCHVVHDHVKLHSLFNCLSIMNGNSESDKRAQVNILHRPKEICK